MVTTLLFLVVDTTFLPDLLTFKATIAKSCHNTANVLRLTCVTLLALAQKPFRLLQANYFMRDGWEIMRGECEELAHNLEKYAQMLQGKNKIAFLTYSMEVHYKGA